jgi:hypothetical protein
MARAIRNGKAYDSVDVETTLNGVPFEIEEINYGLKQEHKLNYKLGSEKPSSWSMGKEEYNCAITVPLHVIGPLEKVAPGGRLTKIRPFFINVTIVNDYNEIINDTILVKFTDQGREVNGDMGLKKQYEMLVLDIDFNN